jgi:hypothetical protein
MQYDSARQRVLLFGGADAAGRLLAETWEWDGVNWVRRTPAASPPARGDHVMAYDSARQRVVLFGGSSSLVPPIRRLADTWEWDGVTWISRNPAVSPPARGRHAMAYDTARQGVVLFGGFGGPTGGTPLADTWTWDGSTWSPQNPATSPPAGRAVMVYDPGIQRAVLVGVIDNSSFPSRDIWEWDGVTWTPRAPVMTE